MKKVFIVVGIIILLILVSIASEVYNIQWMKFFGVMREDARREKFEETKSYNQGKIQDLAKYYEEYQFASDEDKPAIATVIKSQFADFDMDNLNNEKLKSFLLQVRGY
jgi:hypothetical protein